MIMIDMFFFPAFEYPTRAGTWTALRQISKFRLKIRQKVTAIQAGRQFRQFLSKCVRMSVHWCYYLPLFSIILMIIVHKDYIIGKNWCYP